MNARISSHVVSYHVASGLISMHWRAYRFVSSTSFANSSSGNSRRKKSRAVPSSGTIDVGPVGCSKSSTFTSDLSVVHASSTSSSLSPDSSLSSEAEEMSDSSSASLRTRKARCTSFSSKPKNSSSSLSDCRNGFSIAEFHLRITENVCIATPHARGVKRKLWMSAIGWNTKGMLALCIWRFLIGRIRYTFRVPFGTYGIFARLRKSAIWHLWEWKG